jgi:pimeloyl-ACP methyl ester carboxylesterase
VLYAAASQTHELRRINVTTKAPISSTRRRASRGGSLFKRAAIGLAAVLTLLVVSGVVYQAVATVLDRRNFPPPGQMVDVGGYRLHLYCAGEGSPTVILETMSDGNSAVWGWIRPELARTTRVCVYDRAGWGWSDNGPAPRDAQQTVAELDTLLERAGETGPYVLVGHSLGGLYVRLYAAQHAEDIVGVVLIDASHPDQFNRLPAEELAEGEAFQRLAPLLAAANALGVSHLYFALGGEMDFSDLPEQQKAEMKVFWSSPRQFTSGMAEQRVRPETDAQVLATGTLGALPLAVITAGTGSSETWLALQNDLATLSTNAIHITLAEASHASLAFNPEHAQQVSAAILQVVEAAGSGRPLTAPSR